MYCPRCEMTTEPGVLFCQHCGFRLKPASQQTPQPAQTAQTAAAK